MRLYTAILLLCLYFRSNSTQITLHDIVTPADTQRLFDTLQYSVEDQYADQNVAFDVSKLFNYQDAPVSINKLNRKYSDVLYEGDMAISFDQLQRMVKSTVSRREIKKLQEKWNTTGSEFFDRIRGRRQAYLDGNYPETIWETGVPFVFHESLNSYAKAEILRAIHFWYRETCINFRPRTQEDDFLIFIGNEEGCWSTVGKDASQRKQVVSIGEGCEHFGVTSHELAHALGLFHEQSRFDRDNSVIFNKNVVKNDMLYNFAKVSPRELSTYGVPYDVGSVMHYTPTEFSMVKSIPTLTAVDPNLQQTMGQLEGPSFLDVFLLNSHYKCQERCPTQAPCKNGGFTNSRNCKVCKCPSGFGGRFCDAIPDSFSSGCGGVINVQQTVRRFDISIKQHATKRDKQCFYHLKAPSGKKIVLNLLKVDAKCIEGCWQDGIELKMNKDYRPVGYRFCCKESSKRRVMSTTNLVPFILSSRQGDISISFEYTYVDENQRFDDEDSSEERRILERTRHDLDGVASSVSLPKSSRTFLSSLTGNRWL